MARLAIMLPFGLLRSGPFTMFHGSGCCSSPMPPCSPISASCRTMPSGGLVARHHGSEPLVRVHHDRHATFVRRARGRRRRVVRSRDCTIFRLHGIPITSSAPAGLYVNSVQQGAALALLVVALASERMWLWALPLLPGLALAHSRGAWLALAVGLLGHYVRDGGSS